MATISLFTFEELNDVREIAKSIDKNKTEEGWFTAKPSKYNNSEVFVQYWFYEDVEKALKRSGMDEDSLYEITNFLKEHGKTRVLRRNYAFINLQTKTLEIYGKAKALDIASVLGKLLNTNFQRFNLTSEKLQKLLELNEKGNSLNSETVRFKPKIKFLNSNNRYYVTVNSKGEMKLNGYLFAWRPRYEVRQIVHQISAVAGLLSSSFNIQTSRTVCK